MPYSKQRQFEQRKQKLIDKYVEKYYDAAIEAIDKTANELVNEASRVFDNCIDKFYEYETRVYYRHETGRGTGTGINLYRASQIHLNYKNGEIVGFHIGWNANDMASYKHVDSEYVLDNVMNGIRGLEDKYMRKGFGTYDNHWSATVETKYFGTLSGTPNQIFDEIDAKWKAVSYNINKKYRKEAFSKISIR